MTLMTLMMAALIQVSLFRSSGTVHTHSLTWLVVTLNGTKPSLGHTCVGPQDACCETHQYNLWFLLYGSSFLYFQCFSCIHIECPFSFFVQLPCHGF